MAVCWLSARTCSLLPRFCTGRALARLFVLARHRFSFSRHSPLSTVFVSNSCARPKFPLADRRSAMLPNACRPASLLYSNGNERERRSHELPKT